MHADKFLTVCNSMTLKFWPNKSIIAMSFPVYGQFGYPGAVFHFDGQFDVSLRDLSKCCFRPPLAETGVSSLLQPDGALLYQCSPAHWHGTTSKTIACLTSQRPNTDFDGGDESGGGGLHSNITINTS